MITVGGEVHILEVGSGQAITRGADGIGSCGGRRRSNNLPGDYEQEREHARGRRVTHAHGTRAGGAPRAHARPQREPSGHGAGVAEGQSLSGELSGEQDARRWLSGPEAPKLGAIKRKRDGRNQGRGEGGCAEMQPYHQAPRRAIRKAAVLVQAPLWAAARPPLARRSAAAACTQVQ